MGISKRLKTIADLVTPGLRVADIGTDHGYVPIYLLREDRVPYALAVDMSKGSLAKAEEGAEFFHLTERMECRLSDGFANIEPGEIESVIISGMGGILMTRILEDGQEVLEKVKELILSPHRDLELVKQFVLSHGFTIQNELELIDKKHKYTVIKALKS